MLLYVFYKFPKNIIKILFEYHILLHFTPLCLLSFRKLFNVQNTHILTSADIENQQCISQTLRICTFKTIYFFTYLYISIGDKIRILLPGYIHCVLLYLNLTMAYCNNYIN